MAFGESSPAVNQREPFIAGYADDEELVEGVRRGDVFAVRDLGGLERISFPRVDPVYAGSISPRVGKLFENWESLMLQKEFAGGGNHPPESKKSRAYEDLFFRARAGKEGLAVRLWKTDMIRFTKTRRGPGIRCFCVVKKLDDAGDPILRLIMDLRKTNLLFVSPPYTSLANGAAFGFVDLSSSVLEGSRLTSFCGDVPDSFYRLELHPGLSEYFCLDWIQAKRLAQLVGVDLPGPGFEYCALRVIPMVFGHPGWLRSQPKTF